MRNWRTISMVGFGMVARRSNANPVNDATMSDLHMKISYKMRFLQDKGISYESIWECQFDQKYKVNEDLKSIFVASEIVSPLEPSDAFFLGTEPRHLHCLVKPTEKGQSSSVK